MGDRSSNIHCQVLPSRRPEDLCASKDNVIDYASQISLDMLPGSDVKYEVALVSI